MPASSFVICRVLKQFSTGPNGLMADPAWLAYVKKVQAFLLNQETRILNPAPFFAAKLEAMVKAANGVPV